MTALIIAVVVIAALTELQVDQIIDIVESCMKMVGEAIKTVWVSLSPIGISYLIWRQAMNRKALDENTKVSTEAFVVANGHNAKIADLTKNVEEVVKKAIPQEAHITNTEADPVPTKDAP